jgi:hypothetical protein
MAIAALPVSCPFPVGSLLKCKSALGGCTWGVLQGDTPFVLLAKPEMVEATTYEKDMYAFYRVKAVVSCQVFVPSTSKILELRMMLDRWINAMFRAAVLEEK